MGLINYIKTQMKVRRPFLFLLTGFSCFAVGSGATYMLEGSKVTKLREQLSETKQEMIRRESEFQKRLKDKSRTIKVVNPDGSSREETFNDLEVDESGTTTIDVARIAQKLRLTESEYTYLPWEIRVRYAPNNALVGDIGLNHAKYGIEVSRDWFTYLSTGVFVDYDADNSKFWIGLSVGYRF